jgi:DNA repair protein RecO (recombination protein O)
MKTTRTRGIVLRRTNYGEADRIVQFLTPNGRLSVMARGVRKEKSKLAGGIELFAISDIVTGKGKGELGILTSARLIQFYRHILEDYDRLQFAYEVLTQIARASESLDEPEWYDIAAEILMALDTSTVSLSLIETWFYMRMSAMLGDELNILRDIHGEKLQSDMSYRYDSNEKGFVEAAQGDIKADHLKILRLVAAKPLSVLVQVGGMEDYLSECLYVARQHAAL